MIFMERTARSHGDGGDHVGMDNQSVGIIKSLKNKPNASVTVYRAVPDDFLASDKSQT